MIELSLRFYAQLREQAGSSGERLRTDAASPAALWDELLARHAFTVSRDQLRVAVNDGFTGWDHALRDGDTVVFIPPVNGG